MRILCLAVTLSLALSACTFTVVGSAPKTEKSKAHSETVNTTFVGNERFINACLDEGGELSEVRFHTNAAYILVSVLSLGLYVPQNVTWWCHIDEEECAEGDDSGNCEEYVPGGN